MTLIADAELFRAFAREVNGGVFANEYAEVWLARKLVRAVELLDAEQYAQLRSALGQSEAA